jgi:hypothetical protein
MNDKLVAPINFSASRTLANGPIRVLFELDYPAFDANGTKISETLRVSLDAGSQLDHYVAKFKGGSGSLTTAIGIKKTSGAKIDYDAKFGSLTTWEPMEKRMGMQGLGIIVNPQSLVKQAEDDKNQFAIARTDASGAISYWAGFAWDRPGKIRSEEAWKKYITDFAVGWASPIQVSVSGE